MRPTGLLGQPAHRVLTRCDARSWGPCVGSYTGGLMTDARVQSGSVRLRPFELTVRTRATHRWLTAAVTPHTLGEDACGNCRSAAGSTRHVRGHWGFEVSRTPNRPGGSRTHTAFATVLQTTGPDVCRIPCAGGLSKAADVRCCGCHLSRRGNGADG